MKSASNNEKKDIVNDNLGIQRTIRDKVKSKYTLIDVTSSYKCFINCKHCMFNCTPHDVRKELKKEKIVEYLDQIISVGKFKEFSFGGQEVFFNIQEFVEIAEYLNQKIANPVITITTSCYWVKSYEHAKDQLSSLQRLGLKGILISVDDFHQATVNLNKVFLCVKALIDLGLDFSLQTIISKSSMKKADFIQAFEKELPEYDVRKFEWIEHNYTPVGRGAFIDKNELLFEEKPYIGDCSILEILEITPQGEVKPCCGSGSCAKYLTIGNIEENNLSEIIKKVDVNPFINSLFVWVGPQGLMNILSEHGKLGLLSDRHSGACHACYEIFSNEEVYQFLSEKLQETKIELLAARWYVEKILVKKFRFNSE